MSLVDRVFQVPLFTQCLNKSAHFLDNIWYDWTWNEQIFTLLESFWKTWMYFRLNHTLITSKIINQLVTLVAALSQFLFQLRCYWMQRKTRKNITKRQPAQVKPGSYWLPGFSSWPHVWSARISSRKSLSINRYASQLEDVFPFQLFTFSLPRHRLLVTLPGPAGSWPLCARVVESYL